MVFQVVVATVNVANGYDGCKKWRVPFAMQLDDAWFHRWPYVFAARNVEENPSESKFRRIKMANPVQIPEALPALSEIHQHFTLYSCMHKFFAQPASITTDKSGGDHNEHKDRVIYPWGLQR